MENVTPAAMFTAEQLLYAGKPTAPRSIVPWKRYEEAAHSKVSHKKKKVKKEGVGEKK